MSNLRSSAKRAFDTKENRKKELYFPRSVLFLELLMYGILLGLNIAKLVEQRQDIIGAESTVTTPTYLGITDLPAVPAFTALPVMPTAPRVFNQTVFGFVNATFSSQMLTLGYNQTFAPGGFSPLITNLLYSRFNLTGDFSANAVSGMLTPRSFENVTILGDSPFPNTFSNQGLNTLWSATDDFSIKVVQDLTPAVAELESFVTDVSIARIIPQLNQVQAYLSEVVEDQMQPVLDALQEHAQQVDSDIQPAIAQLQTFIQNIVVGQIVPAIETTNEYLEQGVIGEIQPAVEVLQDYVQKVQTEVVPLLNTAQQYLDDEVADKLIPLATDMQAVQSNLATSLNQLQLVVPGLSNAITSNSDAIRTINAGVSANALAIENLATQTVLGDQAGTDLIVLAGASLFFTLALLAYAYVRYQAINTKHQQTLLTKGYSHGRNYNAELMANPTPTPAQIKQAELEIDPQGYVVRAEAGDAAPAAPAVQAISYAQLASHSAQNWLQQAKQRLSNLADQATNRHDYSLLGKATADFTRMWVNAVRRQLFQQAVPQQAAGSGDQRWQLNGANIGVISVEQAARLQEMVQAGLDFSALTVANIEDLSVLGFVVQLRQCLNAARCGVNEGAFAIADCLDQLADDQVPISIMQLICYQLFRDASYVGASEEADYNKEKAQERFQSLPTSTQYKVLHALNAQSTLEGFEAESSKLSRRLIVSLRGTKSYQWQQASNISGRILPCLSISVILAMSWFVLDQRDWHDTSKEYVGWGAVAFGAMTFISLLAAIIKAGRANKEALQQHAAIDSQVNFTAAIADLEITNSLNAAQELAVVKYFEGEVRVDSAAAHQSVTTQLIANGRYNSNGAGVRLSASSAGDVTDDPRQTAIAAIVAYARSLNTEGRVGAGPVHVRSPGHQPNAAEVALNMTANPMRLPLAAVAAINELGLANAEELDQLLEEALTGGLAGKREAVRKSLGEQQIKLSETPIP